MTSLTAYGASRVKPSNPRRSLPNISASRHGSRPLRSSVAAPNFSSAAPYSRGSAVNGYGAVLAHAEIHEVVRIFRPADVAPQVGVGDPQHDFVAVPLEERLQFGRQQIDGPPHDELVRRKSPGERRRRRERRDAARPRR